MVYYYSWLPDRAILIYLFVVISAIPINLGCQDISYFYFFRWRAPAYSRDRQALRHFGLARFEYPDTKVIIEPDGRFLIRVNPENSGKNFEIRNLAYLQGMRTDDEGR